MDFQTRGGNKVGGGGVASSTLANEDRRERLRKLAMETIDLTKDPYFRRNNIGSYDCALCCTIHTNEGSYLAHTQGKKHQTNLAKRAHKEQLHQQKQNPNNITEIPISYNIKRNFVKIGIPGYKVTKMKDANTLQKSILFHIEYNKIGIGITPRYRLMSSYEQKIEMPNDKYQYIIFAAEPYETIAFKIPNYEVDNSEDKYLCNWDEDSKVYTVQIYFKDNIIKSNYN